MLVEVDQSVKIEFTKGNTVLAMASTNLAVPVVCTALVPAAAKRRGVVTLRARGWSETRAAVGLFSAGVFLLLQSQLDRLDRITIDLEYTGHEGAIRSRLVNWARDLRGVDVTDILVFQAVTKGSRAHEAALRVTRGELLPDMRLDLSQLLDLLTRR